MCQEFESIYKLAIFFSIHSMKDERLEAPVAVNNITTELPTLCPTSSLSAKCLSTGCASPNN